MKMPFRWQLKQKLIMEIRYLEVPIWHLKVFYSSTRKRMDWRRSI